jgi:hypothetical protein
VGSEYEVRLSAVSPAGYSETAMASRITVGYLNGTPDSYPGKRVTGFYSRFSWTTANQRYYLSSKM